MSNSYFTFKQFTVRQERCAMKVGTDGVLLGAWVPLNGARRVLDVGTGAGILALMVAQRSHAQVVGIEIDDEAAMQAAENMKESPWSERMCVVQGDFRTVRFEAPFDTILCNPPYFVGSLKAPDEKRAVARHADGSLSCEDFFRSAECVLCEHGTVSVVLPANQRDLWVGRAMCHGLQLFHQTQVRSKEGMPPKRVLLAFSKVAQPCNNDELVIMNRNQEYSDEFVTLMHDFYLKL